MPSTKSRVHPKCKTKYRVGNWADYDLSLVERGNLTIWLSSSMANEAMTVPAQFADRQLDS
ncbi:MAG: hypothetical protein ACI91B_003020 [Planctomycetota bacterium]|jgi:hypothetical protein